MRVQFLALAAVCLVASAAANDKFTVTKTPEVFTIDNFEFSSAFDAPWQEGTIVQVKMTGTTNKKITDGTVKFKLYEAYVTHFEASGNLPYFKCDNKGCDPSQAVSMFLEDPTADSSPYTITFDYTMGAAQKTGVFSLVIWGVDQDHAYDFSVSVGYNYTNAAATGLRGAAPAVPVPEIPELPTPTASDVATLPFKYNVTNGAFTIDSVTAVSSTGSWQAGAAVTVTMTGEIASKQIVAGTLKYKVYEMGVRYFIDQGFSPYFDCTNKGCNVFDGIALKLNDPTSLPTSFVATIKITLPRSVKGGSNPFKLLLWGVDQDHNPADFVVSLDYNLVSGDVAADADAAPLLEMPEMPDMEIPAPTAVVEQTAAPTSLPFKYNVTNGAFTIDSVSAVSSTGSWQAGAAVTVTMTGEIESKQIVAGTLKYKVYEMGVRYFIDQGFSPYFDCTNKGCNVFDGIALKLNDPTSLPTSFVATIKITLPRSVTGGSNPFKLLLWGVDQDHNPADFVVSLDYNLVAGM